MRSVECIRRCAKEHREVDSGVRAVGNERKINEIKPVWGLMHDTRDTFFEDVQAR